MEKADLGLVQEQEQTVYYDGIDVGTRRADFVVEDQVVVEIKALVALEDSHIAQAKNYTSANDFPKGLFFNLVGPGLKHKLISNTNYNSNANEE